MSRTATTNQGTTTTLPKLLNISGVAEHLGVTDRHIRHLVAKRRIPFVKWGHFVRFDPSEIAVWIQENKITSDTDMRRFW